MEIKKYTHACLVLTKNSQSIVVDPGEWSNDFEIPENVVGVIVTHEHADHFSLEKLSQIISKNPSAYIYAHVDVVAQLGEIEKHGKSVTSSEEVSIGDFKVKFVGGEHATIHPDYPVCANLGFIIDDGKLFYPGDSFANPDTDIDILAVPAAAPWLKISEAMEFIKLVNPTSYFPTHDAVLSPEGKKVSTAWLEKAAETVGVKLITL